MSARITQDSVLRVADLPQNRPTGFEIRPDAGAIAALAEALDLSALRKLVFAGTLKPVGKGDWRLEGHLGATVVQPCVVTLAPVTTRIEAGVERRFVARPDAFLPGAQEGEAEVEMPDDVSLEPLTPRIDLAAIMAEALALNLPLYPRTEDAELREAVFTEPGKRALRDEDTRPFAGLSDLRDKLTPKDGDG